MEKYGNVETLDPSASGPYTGSLPTYVPTSTLSKQMKVSLGTLTIANGGTESDELGYNKLRFIRSLTIHGPTALTGTVTLQVNPSKTGGNWVTVQSGGADVEIAADKAVVLDPAPFGRLKIVSSGAEGAQRAFVLFGDEKPI